ncbi:hypothetical protein M9H77_27745 [Catharanthus roseus]|uniref:Uncharacterized protein n=1 Tax=Catharanthus roseus TaxID=4058 RepID=A0ACC0AG24_CATRO|nr:hypothetical protein M9H77_27745 [Catharanthus roseus]
MEERPFEKFRVQSLKSNEDFRAKKNVLNRESSGNSNLNHTLLSVLTCAAPTPFFFFSTLLAANSRLQLPLASVTEDVLPGRRSSGQKKGKKKRTREVYEEKLRMRNMYDYDPTMKPGLGFPPCPYTLSF